MRRSARREDNRMFRLVREPPAEPRNSEGTRGGQDASGRMAYSVRKTTRWTHLVASAQGASPIGEVRAGAAVESGLDEPEDQLTVNRRSSGTAWPRYSARICARGRDGLKVLRGRRLHDGDNPQTRSSTFWAQKSINIKCAREKLGPGDPLLASTAWHPFSSGRSDSVPGTSRWHAEVLLPRGCVTR